MNKIYICAILILRSSSTHPSKDFIPYTIYYSRGANANFYFYISLFRFERLREKLVCFGTGITILKKDSRWPWLVVVVFLSILKSEGSSALACSSPLLNQEWREIPGSSSHPPAFLLLSPKGSRLLSLSPHHYFLNTEQGIRCKRESLTQHIKSDKSISANHYQSSQPKGGRGRSLQQQFSPVVKVG